MAMGCIFIAILLFSLLLRSTLAAASPASSNMISTLSPVSVQGMDDATSWITQAKPRKLKGGGGRSGGSSGVGRSGSGRSSGGRRVFVPRTGASGSSAAAPRSGCLGMATLTVLATSLMVILYL